MRYTLAKTCLFFSVPRAKLTSYYVMCHEQRLVSFELHKASVKSEICLHVRKQAQRCDLSKQKLGILNCTRNKSQKEGNVNKHNNSVLLGPGFSSTSPGSPRQQPQQPREDWGHPLLQFCVLGWCLSLVTQPVSPATQSSWRELCCED